MVSGSGLRELLISGRVCVLGCAIACARMQAQQLIGYVSTQNADVTGASDVMDGHAVLVGSAGVVAKDRTAEVTLGRGGMVRVCQTSAVRLTESRSADAAAPLLVSLERGAIEVQMGSTASDVVMTPDLRFAVRGGGRLDLRMRVARNGDTCVENRGVGAPMLAVSDPFGESMYELLPGQHVLFEHGSLREVVDHESSNCGCPDSAGVSIAEALLKPGVAGGGGGKAATAKATPAEQHPFPDAVSAGLAPVADVPQATQGEVHAQVADTLSYSAKPEVATAAPMASGTTEVASTPAAATPQTPPHDLAHAVGRFFRRLFGRG